MEVFLIAHTHFNKDAFQYATGFASSAFTDADGLAESAGRLCYKSWSRPNPKTADNKGYLRNIIEHQHFSVLEHASATFLIKGVSRSLLAELTRHRHLSFSVESQRYVDQTGRDPVIPPAARGTDAERIIADAYADAVDVYEQLVKLFGNLKHKQAREAARAVLPNCQPVDLIVTGNMRAWREVLTKRYHIAADAEIQELASELLMHLKLLAPNTFQDFEGTAIRNDRIRRAS